MKLKGSEAVNLSNSYSALEMQGVELPFKAWYAINKTRKSLDEALETLNTAREHLLKKYAVSDCNGGYATVREGNVISYKFKDEKSKSIFEKEFSPLLEDKFDVKVKKVRTMNFKGKMKNTSVRSNGKVLRTTGYRADWKKAIIILQEGHEIDIVGGEI